MLPDEVLDVESELVEYFYNNISLAINKFVFKFLFFKNGHSPQNICQILQVVLKEFKDFIQEFITRIC